MAKRPATLRRATVAGSQGSWLAFLLALGGCDNAPDQGRKPGAVMDASSASDRAAPYSTELPLAEFMPHVMQYAANGIWKHQGLVLDRQGTHSLLPKTDEEWEEAESGARTLAEITNVLLIPGRRVEDPRWDTAALGVRQVALRAADAAEHKDVAGWSKAGGDLDEACDACHLRFDPRSAAKTGG